MQKEQRLPAMMHQLRTAPVRLPGRESRGVVGDHGSGLTRAVGTPSWWLERCACPIPMRPTRPGPARATAIAARHAQLQLLDVGIVFAMLDPDLEVVVE